MICAGSSPSFFITPGLKWFYDGFEAFNTASAGLAVGIMILPAAAARLWVCSIGPLLLLAVFTALLGSTSGLLLSYYINVPAGPAIVLTLGALYLLSLALGPLGPLAGRRRAGWHFER